MAPAGDDVYVSDSEAAGLVDDIYECDPLLNQDFDFGEINTRKIKRQKQIMVTASILFLWIGVVFSGAVFVFYNDPTLKQLFRPGSTFGLVPCDHSLDCDNGYCVSNQCTPCALSIETDCGLVHSKSAKWCTWDRLTASCGISRRHALASSASHGAALAPNASIPKISMSAADTDSSGNAASSMSPSPVPASPPSRPPPAAPQSALLSTLPSPPTSNEDGTSLRSPLRANSTTKMAVAGDAAAQLRVEAEAAPPSPEITPALPCVDDLSFQDEFYAARCSFFSKAAAASGCFDLTYWGSQFRYTDTQLEALRRSCPVTCELCSKVTRKADATSVPEAHGDGDASEVAVPLSVPQLMDAPRPGPSCRFTPLNGTQLTPCTASACSGIDWAGFTNLDLMSATCYHVVKDYCQANLFDFVGCTPELFTALRGYGDTLASADLAASFADIDDPPAVAEPLAPQQLSISNRPAPPAEAEATPAPARPQAAVTAPATRAHDAVGEGSSAAATRQGQGVPSAGRLRTITTQCVDIETPNDYSYHWVRALSLGPSKAVVVSVRAPGDAHVGFFVKEPGLVTHAQNVPPRTYEFVLGAQSNTQTEIHRRDVKGSRVTATTRKGVLSMRMTRSFWFTAKGGLLRTGVGGHVGANTTAAWRDQLPLDAHYIGVETVGGTGAWTVCSVEVQARAKATPVAVTALHTSGPRNKMT